MSFSLNSFGSRSSSRKGFRDAPPSNNNTSSNVHSTHHRRRSADMGGGSHLATPTASADYRPSSRTSVFSQHKNTSISSSTRMPARQPTPKHSESALPSEHVAPRQRMPPSDDFHDEIQAFPTSSSSPSDNGIGAVNRRQGSGLGDRAEAALQHMSSASKAERHSQTASLKSSSGHPPASTIRQPAAGRRTPSARSHSNASSSSRRVSSPSAISGAAGQRSSKPNSRQSSKPPSARSSPLRAQPMEKMPSTSQLSSSASYRPRSPLKMRPRSHSQTSRPESRSTSAPRRPSAPQSAASSPARSRASTPNGRGTSRASNNNSVAGRGRGRAAAVPKPPWVDPVGTSPLRQRSSATSVNSSFHSKPIYNNNTSVGSRGGRAARGGGGGGGGFSGASTPRNPQAGGSVSGATTPRRMRGSTTSRATTGGPLLASASRADRHMTRPTTQEEILMRVPHEELERLARLPRAAEPIPLGLTRMDYAREEDLKELFRQQYIVDPLMVRRPGRRQFNQVDHLTNNGILIYNDNWEEVGLGSAEDEENQEGSEGAKRSSQGGSGREVALVVGNGQLDTVAPPGEVAVHRDAACVELPAEILFYEKVERITEAPHNKAQTVPPVSAGATTAFSNDGSFCSPLHPAKKPSIHMSVSSLPHLPAPHHDAGEECNSCTGSVMSAGDEAAASALENKTRFEQSDANVFSWEGPMGEDQKRQNSVRRRRSATPSAHSANASTTELALTLHDAKPAQQQPKPQPQHQPQLTNHNNSSSRRSSRAAASDPPPSKPAAATSRQPASGRTAEMNALDASKDHDIFGVSLRIQLMAEAAQRRQSLHIPEQASSTCSEPYGGSSRSQRQGISSSHRQGDTPLTNEPFSSKPVLSVDVLHGASNNNNDTSRGSNSHLTPRRGSTFRINTPKDRPRARSPGKCKPKDHDLFGRSPAAGAASESPLRRGRGAGASVRTAKSPAKEFGPTRGRSPGNRSANTTSPEVQHAFRWKM